MPESIIGMHHVTANASDPEHNLDFYCEEFYRRIRVESLFGKLSVFVTHGHLPYPLWKGYHWLRGSERCRYAG